MKSHFAHLTALLCFLFSLSTSLLVAQQDPQADKVLHSARIKMNGLHDFSAKFNYLLENKAVKSKPVAKNGFIKVKKNKYRIDFTDQLLICDGKTMWNLLKTEKEVNVSDYDPNESFSIERVFRLYQEDMKSQYNQQELINGKPSAKITLFPGKSKTDYFKVEMWVDVKESIPRQIKVYGRNGSNVTYQLTDVKTNTNVADGDFTFNKAAYPGVEEINMRDSH